jgi:dinuclear metal center YbgI/SA1388 family protein
MHVDLPSVTAALGEIAPLHLAEEWDNVGLLVEPSRPRPIRRILLTIDLTDAVLDEAIRGKADMIVAYHPPIFEPIKRLDGRSAITRLVERGIAVYSPHTALDAIFPGVNDWIAAGLGSYWSTSPIKPAPAARPFNPVGPVVGGFYAPRTAQEDEKKPRTVKVVVFVPAAAADRVRQAMADQGAGHIGDYSHCSFNIDGQGTFLGGQSTKPTVGKKGRLERVPEVRLEMVAYAANLSDIIPAIRKVHPYEEPAIDIYPLEGEPDQRLRRCGQGRTIWLHKAVSLSVIVRRLKKHLGVRYVRVAATEAHQRGRRIMTLSICAGAGGSVLRQCTNTELYITGEMRHHDILAANARGISVILCDHTNTERGALTLLRKALHDQLGKSVRIDISKADREPLSIV